MQSILYFFVRRSVVREPYVLIINENEKYSQFHTKSNHYMATFRLNANKLSRKQHEEVIE